MDLEIKICGMVLHRNIIDVSETCPNYMGFIFYKESPRYVGKFNPRILNDLQSCTEPVAVFVNSSIEEVVNICSKNGFRIVQLHGNESPEYCRDLKGYSSDLEGFQIWKAISIGLEMDWDSLKQYSGVVDRFLFDTKCMEHGGSGKKFDWTLLDGYTLDILFMLSGGIRPEDAKKIAKLKHPMMAGVDLNSGFESSPGFKWVPYIRDFQHELYSL
ncbi:MAG: phosphoribosylanthranilate isomerase [Muribaculum sp.]|nr:phosphoribosylanthranilate isomerase [Muribaculum sp.]